MSTTIERLGAIPWGQRNQIAGGLADDRIESLTAYLLRGTKPERLARYLPAARRMGVDLYADEVNVQLLSESEVRDLSAQLPASGAYVSSDNLIHVIERRMQFASPVRANATVFRTPAAAVAVVPSFSDLDNEGEQLRENTAATEDTVVLTATRFKGYSFGSKIVRVPHSLVEDAAGGFERELGNVLGDRVGRIQNRAFTLGDGGSEPVGITKAATLGVTTANALAFTYDELISLPAQLNIHYRSKAKWMMSMSTWLVVEKMKDGDGYPLVERRRPGEPLNINGDAVVINGHMPSIESAARPIVYGDLRQFRIRDASMMRVMRWDEKYAESDQHGFAAIVRSDTGLADPTAIVALQMA